MPSNPTGRYGEVLRSLEDWLENNGYSYINMGGGIGDFSSAYLSIDNPTSDNGGLIVRIADHPQKKEGQTVVGGYSAASGGRHPVSDISIAPGESNLAKAKQEIEKALGLPLLSEEDRKSITRKLQLTEESIRRLDEFFAGYPAGHDEITMRQKYYRAHVKKAKELQRRLGKKPNPQLTISSADAANAIMAKRTHLRKDAERLLQTLANRKALGKLTNESLEAELYKLNKKVYSELGRAADLKELGIDEGFIWGAAREDADLFERAYSEGGLKDKVGVAGMAKELVKGLFKRKNPKSHMAQMQLSRHPHGGYRFTGSVPKSLMILSGKGAPYAVVFPSREMAVAAAESMGLEYSVENPAMQSKNPLGNISLEEAKMVAKLLPAHGNVSGVKLRQKLEQLGYGTDEASLLNMAQDAANKYLRSSQQYEQTLDSAAVQLWGRPFQVTDYRISGIGSAEFSEAHKDALRVLLSDRRAYEKAAFVFVKATGKRNAVAVYKKLIDERRSNPVNTQSDSLDLASQVSEGFHQRPVKEIIEQPDHLFIHTNLAKLGDMRSLKVKLVTGGKCEIEFTPGQADCPMLCSDPEAQQLYIEGGDQSIDLPSMGFDGPMLAKDKITLGDIVEITYLTEKSFDNFEPVEYFHKLGEESGVRPQLIYDTHNQHLLISGGDYTIEDRGIVN